MSLFKRGDTWHYDFTVDRVRYRESTGFTRKADAQAFEDQKRREAKLGNLHRAIPTLKDVAEAWFASSQKGGRSEECIRIRLNTMLRLMGGTTKITAIGSREVAEGMQKRRMERTHRGTPPVNSTINVEFVATLQPILKHAAVALEQNVKTIIWAKLRLREPAGRKRQFSSEELAAWRACLPVQHRETFDFYRRYASRLQEAFFPLDRFDAEAGEIRFREEDRKTGAFTIVMRDDDAALMRARAGRARAAGLNTVWFRQMEDGSLKANTARGFQCASRRALKLSGITDARPTHDLRHHAATVFLSKTNNLALVKDLLGHANISSTMRYAHTDKKQLKEALRHAYDTDAPEIAENASENSALEYSSRNI